MSISWTNDQLRAIESRNGALLVSAAAGSGKTAVLVERLLRRVALEGIDIDKFLMITYTNAAASELRAKIIAALGDKIAENPDDKHLMRQMSVVHRASISTIHAYCTQVLRTHGHILGITDDFKIIDESEAENYRRNALEDLLEDEYEAARPEFNALCEALCGERDDSKMAESVLALHQKSRTHPNPKKWLLSCAKMYDTDGEEWAREIISYVHEICAYLKKRLAAVNYELKSDSALDAAYAPVISGDIKKLEALCDASSWDELFSAISTLEFARLSPVRGCESEELKEWAKSERNDVKKEIGKICERFLCKSKKTISEEISALRPVAHELVRVASELDVRYTKIKRARGVLDYADLEHEALALLVEDYDEENDAVTPTELARELADDFCEIMIDEYQDSNCIQDIIFRAVSKNEQNLTMVGDLKQSIYRFRLADPTIFLRKYKNFCDYEAAQNGMPRVVNLSQNFRSREEVLRSCNDYFSLCMSERLGELEYTEREYLNLGASYPETEDDSDSEFILLDLNEEHIEGELPPSAREIEARYIAARIQEMVKNGAEYGDIVILLRSLSGRAHIYERALREYSIPCSSDKSEGLLGTVEVSVLISFLQTIDNPLWDIPLVSTLRSPLFAFTADDLAFVRRHKRGFFFDALTETAREQNETGSKCREFLKILTEFRSLSSEIGVDELIWKLMDRTMARGLFGAMEEGSARVENLHELYKYAERFEQGGFRGLHAFLGHIAHITEHGGDIPRASGEGCADEVRIMSIHKSKGLEFPIVFLADCNRQFNEMDLREQVLIHPKFGIGLNFRDNLLRYECPSLARMCISLALRNEMKSEELRVLYVAMTRAKEKLILVCTERDAIKSLDKAKNSVISDEVSPIALLGASKADMWFLMPVCARERMFKLSVVHKNSISPPPQYQTEKDRSCHAQAWQTEELQSRFEFKYPYENSVNTQAKLTATGIAHDGVSKRRHFARPQFVKERGLTPAERGIALHLAMQLVDFSKCETLPDVENELCRLYEGEYLSKEQYEVIDVKKIFAFFESELGRAATSSTKIWREFNFSRLVPVNDNDTALLQGVADLVFEKDGGLVIVDFKSDRSINEQNLEGYKRQLSVYSESLELILQKPVLARYIYFLQYGKSINL